MIRKRLKAPSPALIISLIALFAAIGGTSYAAATIGTAQIKNKAVTNAKLAPLSVGTAKIRDAAVSQAKLAITTQGASVSVPNGQKGTVTAGCPSGTVILTGGGGFPGVAQPYALLENSNASGTSGWTVEGWNINTGQARTLVARAVCIRP
jgi:hypothetical protein